MRLSKRFCQNAWLSVTLVWSGAGCAPATAPTREWADAPDRPSVKQPADAPIPGPEEAETTDPLWQQIKEARRQDAEDSATRALDPQAEALLRQVAERIQRAQTFRVDIRVSTTERYPGSNLTLVSEHSLAVKRPDHLAFVTKHAAFETVIRFGGCNESRAEIPYLELEGQRYTARDEMLSVMVSDGKELSLEIPALGGPQIGDLPSGRDPLGSLFSIIYDISPLHGDWVNSLLRNLVSEDATQSEMFGVPGLVDDGTETVDGAKCRRLRLGPRGVGGYCFLVEDAAAPLLRQVRPLRDPTETTEYVEQSTTFRNWKFDVALPDDEFAMPAARAGRAGSPATSGTHP